MPAFFILIFAFIFTPGARAEGPQCLLLFAAKEASSKPLDREYYSWRRFHAPLHVESQQTPLELEWQKKMNTPIPSWSLKHFFKDNDEVYASIHMSSDQSTVVTRSNKNILRVYNAQSKKLISEINIRKEYHRDLGHDRVEVIFANHQYIVLGKEESSHIHKNQNMGIFAFHPNQLTLIDLEGRLISNFYSDVRVKGAIVGKKGNFWITADQYELRYHDLLIESHLNLNANILSKLPGADYFISAISLSSDENIVYVAFSKLKGRAGESSTITAIDIKDPRSPKLIKEFEIPSAQVIYKMEYTTEGLKVRYSNRDQTDKDPTQSTIIDIWELNR